MKKLTVGLFNDSFPPTIDGVANVALNYARIINRDYGAAVVATPKYPRVTDDYPFEVIRYPSAYMGGAVGGYRAGIPFDPITLAELEKRGIDIIHSHCPMVSTVLARTLRRMTGAPIILTYHTKFDIDIEKATASDALRRASIKFIVDNISACDEVWAVSQGAGENLRSLGYEGDYIVMPNGTDFERGRAPEGEVDALRKSYGIGPEIPVFLFVGRMMWYKGVRLSLDGLARARERGLDFRFILVGDGTDRKEIEEYAEKLGLADRCVFTGAIRDRELLRAYFTLADLFLFPSTFDTNGIVVREAAACYCPSLLIAGSCAAEGISDGDTGVIIEENTEAMLAAIESACADREGLKRIGRSAAEKIYLSWDDAVRGAFERYQIVAERQPRSERAEDTRLPEAFSGAVEQLVDDFEISREQLEMLLWDTRDWAEHLLGRGRAYFRDAMTAKWELPRLNAWGRKKDDTQGEDSE